MKISVILSACIFGFSALVCPSKNELPGGSVFAVSSSPVKRQETSSREFECENIAGIIGFARINFDGSTVLNFYTKPNAAKQPAQVLRFYDDKDLKMFSFKVAGKKSYSLLRPEVHKLDYSLFNLRVKNRRGGWFEVVVDDRTKETLWLRENKAAEFEDWLQNMKKSFAVERLNSKTNPLRIKPGAAAKEISFGGQDCFKVQEMKGDWVRVTKQNVCDETSGKTVSGWIRWRDENGCLLVEIFPFA